MSSRSGRLELLRLAHRWRAVLLLDEADVYLERWAAQDVLRNSLVSVFLRSLEYYRGIFFLTTNRVRDFDEAACSGIHLFLKYDNLEATRKIWKTFLRGAETVGGPRLAVPNSMFEAVGISIP